MAEPSDQSPSSSHGAALTPESLLPLVYRELRQLAAAKLAKETPGHTLQPTALVHEAYVRLVQSPVGGWKNRAHFFAAAAEAMRRILIESARRKRQPRRGGGRQRLELDEAVLAIEPPSDKVVELSDALDRLAAEEPALAELVKLHYFAGLTFDEIAEVRGVSERTVYRQWAYAKSWLAIELGGGDKRQQ
jgi:RNA polymerase sigma factor (TIGR02999 family)